MSVYTNPEFHQGTDEKKDGGYLLNLIIGTKVPVYLEKKRTSVEQSYDEPVNVVNDQC